MEPGEMKAVLALVILGVLSACISANTVLPINNEDDLHSSIKNSDSYLFLMLYDHQCAHCQAFLPKYEEIAEKLEKKYSSLKFVLVDLHSQPRLVDEYMKIGLSTFPFLALYDKGQLVDRFHFGDDDNKAVDWIDEKMKDYHPTHKEMARKTSSEVILAKAKPTSELSLSSALPLDLGSTQQQPLTQVSSQASRILF